MAKKQKTSLYLLAIVSIVASVGIVVLILNSTSSSVSFAANDIAGYAVLVGENTSNTSNTTNATRYCGDGFCDPPEFGKCKKDCPMPPPKSLPMNTTNSTTTNTSNSTY